MQKFLDWLERVLTPLAKVIGENKYLVAIRDGFLLSTPLLIVGSVFLLIANFPLPQWDTWMSHLLGKDWATMMSVPASASFDVMTILAVVGIAYSLGKQFNVDAMQAGIIALVSFFIVLIHNSTAPDFVHIAKRAGITPRPRSVESPPAAEAPAG